MLGNCHLLYTVILKYSEIQCVYIYIYMTTCALCNCIHYVEMISWELLTFNSSTVTNTHVNEMSPAAHIWALDQQQRCIACSVDRMLIGPIGDFLCQMHRQDTCTSHELHLPVVKVMSLKSGSRKITHASSKLLKLWVYSDPLWPRPFSAIYWMEDTEK